MKFEQWITESLSYGCRLRSTNYKYLSDKYNLTLYFIDDLVFKKETKCRGNLKIEYSYDEVTNTILTRNLK